MRHDSPYQARQAPTFGFDEYFAAEAPVDVRAGFIQRTYAHLTGAILAFAALTATFIQTDAIREPLFNLLRMPYGAIVMMVAFLGAGYLAQYWAHASTSRPMQYLGLGLYVVMEALIFTPLLYVASNRFPNVVPNAALLTAVIFAGLTVVMFVTKADLSSWGPYLSIAGFAALGMMLCAWIFGFHLGILFTGVMLALASGYILYDTSRVMHEFRTDQHVGAALELFASVALLFWYVVRLLMDLQRGNNN